MSADTGYAGFFCGDFPEAPLFEKAVLRYIKETADSGLIVTDRELRIVCLNRWVEVRSGKTAREAAWRNLFEVFPEILERGRDRYFRMVLDGQPAVLSYGLHKYLITMTSGDGAGPMFQTARIYPLEDGDQLIGTLTQIYDVTDRVRREKELQTTIEELQEALKQVKTLSGMLPICANCKRIRDDKGYWNQVESYISAHSDVLFSHSICPECAKQLYPEYYQVIYPDQETGTGNAEVGSRKAEGGKGN